MDDLEHMEQELEEVKKDYRDGKDLDPELARVCRKTNLCSEWLFNSYYPLPHRARAIVTTSNCWQLLLSVS